MLHDSFTTTKPAVTKVYWCVDVIKEFRDGIGEEKGALHTHPHFTPLATFI